MHDESVNVRFLNRIEEQAERLNQLILDLLSLARLESGQEVYRARTVGTWRPWCASCVESHRDRATTKKQTLTLDVARCSAADPRPCRRGGRPPNSRQPHRQRDQVHARRRRRPRDLAGSKPIPSRWLWRTPGSASRARTCRAFSNGFTAWTRHEAVSWGARGSDLSIVKHLVQSIGGQIAVESRVGAGSTFTVQFPRQLTPLLRAELMFRIIPATHGEPTYILHKSSLHYAEFLPLLPPRDTVRMRDPFSVWTSVHTVGLLGRPRRVRLRRRG